MVYCLEEECENNVSVYVFTGKGKCALSCVYQNCVVWHLASLCRCLCCLFLMEPGWGSGRCHLGPTAHLVVNTLSCLGTACCRGEVVDCSPLSKIVESCVILLMAPKSHDKDDFCFFSELMQSCLGESAGCLLFVIEVFGGLAVPRRKAGCACWCPGCASSHMKHRNAGA